MELKITDDVDGLPSYSLDYPQTKIIMECEQGPLEYIMD